MTKIFKTIKNTSRKGGPDYDAKLIPFEGSNKVFHYFANPNMYGVEKLPKKIFFLGNFEYIGQYDVPFIGSNLYVFSKKMTRILKEFNDFDFIEVPVIMIDDTFKQKPFDKNGNLNPKAAVNEDYSALRFSELKDYFDFENSEYTVPSYDPNGVGVINKLVLSEPKEGFSSLFRTIQKATTIFVREDLKQALEANDIKGYIFEEVEVTPYLSK